MTNMLTKRKVYNLKLFPRLIGILANLSKLPVNDAQDIARLMKYDISKYLFEVPDPYSIQYVCASRELTMTLNS